MNNFVYAIVSFVVALFFILFGVVATLLPWIPAIRTEVVQFLLESSFLIFLFGVGLVFIGVAIIASVLINTKHRRYVLRRGSRSVFIDENVIDGYLRTYWKRIFPRAEIPHHIVIKRNKIFVSADLPIIAEEDQEKRSTASTKTYRKFSRYPRLSRRTAPLRQF
ncbi:MAG: hypothetical protein H7A37_08385 [Chlamydiales bacterium]|nr:hypothetical protein [Chlamydiales bacterium]